MKIGILGGSFNPAHQGHINISNLALKKMHLDQIWWIPTLFNPLKDKSVYSSLDLRIKECKSISSTHPKIFVKKYPEIFTFNLIERLEKIPGNNQFYFIMGADSFINFHKWKNFSSLIDKVYFVIFSRDNFFHKISKTKAWEIYRAKKFYSQSSNSIVNNLYPTNSSNAVISHSNAIINDYLNCRFKQFSNRKLPKFFIFPSKNFNISSSKIRQQLSTKVIYS